MSTEFLRMFNQCCLRAVPPVLPNTLQILSLTEQQDTQIPSVCEINTLCVRVWVCVCVCPRPGRVKKSWGSLFTLILNEKLPTNGSFRPDPWLGYQARGDKALTPALTWSPPDSLQGCLQHNDNIMCFMKHGSYQSHSCLCGEHTTHKALWQTRQASFGA